MPFQAEGGGGLLPQQQQQDNPPPDQPKDTFWRLDTVERESGATLPTDVSVSLAQTLDPGELQKAAVILARKLDFAPTFLLHPAMPQIGHQPLADYATRFGAKLGDLTDPITGGAMSLATARRLLKPFDVPVMRSILTRALRGQPERNGVRMVNGEPRLRHFEATDVVDPGRVIQAVASLSPLEGDTFRWDQALGAAVQIARTQVSLPLFQRNLDVTRQVPNVSPLQAIAIAHVAARFGTQLNTIADVLAFAYPEAKGPITEAASALQQRAAAGAAEARYEQTRGGVSPVAQIAQEAAQQTLAHGAPSVKMAEGLLTGNIARTATDYLRAAHLIGDQFRVEQQDLHNTFAYKALGAIGHAWNTAYNYVASSFWRGRAEMASTDLVIPQAGGIERVKQSLIYELDTARLIQDGRESIGQAFAQDWHLPRWSAPIADLGFAFLLDPTIMAGKVVGAVRSTRFLIEAPGAITRGLDAASVAGKVDEFLNRPLRQLRLTRLGSGMTVPEYLVREALRSKSPERFFVSAVDRFRTYWATEGLDHTLAAQIFDYSRAARGAGRPIGEVAQTVRDMLGVGFGLNPSKLGERLAMEREAIDRTISERAYRDVYDRYWATPPDLAHQIAAEGEHLQATKDEAWLLSVLDDTETSLLTGARSLNEIPHFRPTTDLMQAIGRTGLADSAPGKALSATFNKTPRAMFDLEGLEGPSFPEQIATYLRRGRVHSQQEIAAARLNAARVIDPLHPTREAAFSSIVQKAQDEVVARKAAAAGWSVTDAERHIAEARALADESNRLLAQSRLYGVMSSEPSPGQVISEQAREPLGPTQLLNKRVAVDPVQVERILRGNFLSLRRLENAVRGVFGRSTRPVMPNAALALRLDRISSGWRRLVVTRPAYVTRVVLLDENARYAATLGLFSHLEATRTGARVLTAVDRLLGKEPFTLRVPRPEGEIALEFPRPGLLPNEPAVAANVSQRGVLESMAQEGRRVSRVLRQTGGFRAVTQDAPHFLQSWAHDLNAQFGRDPVLSRMLSDVVEGRSIEESARRAVEFLTNDPMGRRFASRMNIQNLDAWSTFAARIVREYTAADPVLARAALSDTVDAGMLQGVPKERWPFEVHGPELEISSTKGQSIWHSAAEQITRSILERPTNALNRQPFFKAWYTAARKSMISQAAVEGRVLDDALLAKIDEAAGRFGREQVRRIMFDMRDNGRLGEMLRFVVPFFQPWAEAFTVWGRIAMQNPAIIGYAYEAIHQGIRSGFFRRNPDTGQLEVPMSNWLGAGPLLHAAFGGHWHLSAPLTGFNLFFNSTVPLPTGGFAGNVPLPFPGFSPWATLVMQKIAENPDLPEGVKHYLSSFLYQYGPTTPSAFLPRWLKYAALYTIGGAVDQSAFNATANDFLRLQQLMGVRARTDEPPPGISGEGWATMGDAERIHAWDTWLSSNAKQHAREFFGMRSVISAFFPAAPRIEFPMQQYTAEYQGLTAKLGFEKGRAEFLRRHPDLSLITIPNTMWNRDLGHSVVPVPATQQVAKIMALPGFHDFARRHPQWWWAIIPSEARNGKFDLNTYFQQIASGLRTSLTPEDVLQEGDRQAGWDTYFAARQQHENTLEGFDARNIGPTSPPYERERARWNSYLDDLRRIHPDWALSYDSFSTRSIDPKSVAWARHLVRDPLFSKTAAGKWLDQYLGLLDHVFSEMQSHNIHSLQSKAASQLGLTKLYGDTVASLNKEFPDGALAYRAFFSDALQVKVTAGDRALLNLGPEGARQVTDNWARWTAALDAPAQADPGPQKIQAFLHIRDLANSAFDEPQNRNWLLLWWRAKDPQEQHDYRMRVMGRPYEFLSRFDRQVVLGEQTSASSEARWSQLASDQLRIAQFRAANPEAPAAPLYQALDAQVAGWARTDLNFRTQVEHANLWGWSLQQTLPEIAKGSDSRKYWGAFLDALRTVQATVDQPIGVSSTTGQPTYLHGPDIDVDPGRKGLWIRLKQALETYRDQLFAENPQFAREWSRLEKLNGYSSLIDALFPNTYFPLGGYAYAPVRKA